MELHAGAIPSTRVVQYPVLPLTEPKCHEMTMKVEHGNLTFFWGYGSTAFELPVMGIHFKSCTFTLLKGDNTAKAPREEHRHGRAVVGVSLASISAFALPIGK